MLKRILPFILVLTWLVSPAYGDIIPEDMKPIHISSIIENAGEYPAYTFVEIETMGDEIRAGNVIGPDGRVAKGYKFNKLHILAVPSGRIKEGTISDWQAFLDDTSIPRFRGEIEAGQELVPRDSPRSGRVNHYRITGIEDGAIHMEKIGTRQLSVEPGVTIAQFNQAFLITFCIELIVMVLLIRIGYRSKTPGPVRIGLSVLAAQTATLPFLWYILIQMELTGPIIFLLAEAFAIAVEGAIYKPLLRMTWTGAMLASLLCNAISVLVGFWV